MKHFLLILTLVGSMKTFAQTLENDRLALVALYNSTKGSGWTSKTGWVVPGVTGDNPCGWFGITCVAGRVTGVDLNHNSLNGTLPAQLNNLSALANLDLSFNSLKGTIPNILGIPVSAFVDISNNQFLFDGMAANINLLDKYSPQAKIKISGIYALGRSFRALANLFVSAGYPVANNTYAWYRDGILVETKTGNDFYYDNVYGSTYRVEVTNSVANALTLVSEDYIYLSGSMPVTMVTFTGQKFQSSNLLTWKTTSETNNSAFEIEKSPDAKTFEKIGFVDGNGDSKEDNTYNFTDESPFSTTYYLLKQIDFDGKFEYSRIISVKNEALDLAIYPNPAQNQLFINNLQKPEEVLIRDLSGKVFLKETANSMVPINTSNFPPGLYFIKVGDETRKILIQK